MSTEENRPSNFIRTIVIEDLESGKHDKIVTRFPPEPNGYMHIGHAKAFCLSHGIAREFGGQFNLRFDDTNPEKEDTEYVESIREDIRWIVGGWDKECFASDYYDQLFDYAVQLIKDGKAFVCDLNAEQIREYRGTLTTPGKDSPYKTRSIEENLDLFMRMKAGEFEEGSRTLRAKIDMASPNINMRDPAIYRIKKAHHHRTGDKWMIYPMYDFTHCLSDSIEGITHSLCSLEFEDNRPLYDWFINELDTPEKPRQIEFARLNLTYTLMSKRKMLRLVKENWIDGWDDPRMWTISGLRRRGYTPEAVRDFIGRIGVSKADSMVDMALLEACLREDLNKKASRYMGVLNPLKVVITNYPEGESEQFDCVNNPEDPSAGTRKVPFGRELYIERDDFMEDPPKKFFRLAPGREVRLRYAYFITCDEVVKDSEGEIVELRCTYDPATRGGDSPDGRKVKATMHWVSAKHAIKSEVRLFGPLFTTPTPGGIEDGSDFTEYIDPDSRKVLEQCYIEPALKDAEPGFRFQFERLGYFCVDPDSTAGHPVINRAVTLRDAWAKLQKKGG